MSRLALDILEEMIQETATTGTKASLAVSDFDKHGCGMGNGLRIQTLLDARNRIRDAYIKELEAEHEDGWPPCPQCGRGMYDYKTPGGTEVWTCGHAIGK